MRINQFDNIFTIILLVSSDSCDEFFMLLRRLSHDLSDYESLLRTGSQKRVNRLRSRSDMELLRRRRSCTHYCLAVKLYSYIYQNSLDQRFY